jgi:polysaccharide export outer membrane protein
MKRVSITVLACGAVALFSQQLPRQQTGPSGTIVGAGAAPYPGKADDYVLGPGDQVAVVVPDLEAEFTDKTFRVDMSGDVTLPYAGRIHAAGLSTSALEEAMRTRLARVLKNPEVIISLSTFGSQPVSILGAVNSPGIRQIEGNKNLFEVLSLAGGLRPDAGYLIRVTREMRWGLIQLPDAQADATGRTSSVSIRVKDIIDAKDSSQNIEILPGDRISVPKADVVYAVGSVTKPGGFLLNEHETLSALQVLSLAEGLQRTAAPEKARIVRTVQGSSSRIEIPANLKVLLSGKGPDVPLRGGDILFVPTSGAKVAGYKTLDAVVGMSASVLLYTH